MLTMESVIVVGAGCFGAWTAYHLARSGHDVTLLDAYGPGNSRASSGGETRIIRMSYGTQEIYTRWSWRSLEIWKALFERTDPLLFRETGVLWMARDQDPLATSTLATLERVGVPHERLSRAQLASRWPQIDFGPACPEPVERVTWAIHEPGSGVLMARRAVEAVVREAAREGVRYVEAAVNGVQTFVGRERLEAVTTRSGERIGGAAFVFACGPWLPTLFPDLLGDRIFSTRQEVLYFGPPAGDSRFAPPATPAWIDFGEEMYGIPDIEARGFKIALDRHGAPFDPDTGDRVAGETIAAVRAYMARRFPALHDAPLVAAEVCQYENTCNGDFLIDRHPGFDNVWLVGGGSGHGFKHGPVVGEYVARLVADGGEVDERFRLATKEKVQQRTVY
jgi:monomeric sarcosine oxidase